MIGQLETGRVGFSSWRFLRGYKGLIGWWGLPAQAEADGQLAQAAEVCRKADAMRQRAEAHAAQLRCQLSALQVRQLAALWCSPGGVVAHNLLNP